MTTTLVSCSFDDSIPNVRSTSSPNDVNALGGNEIIGGFASDGTLNLNTGGESFITSISPSVVDGVLLETIDLSPTGSDLGLAVDNTDTISIPESSNFWGLGMFGLLGIFVLKRSKK
ncbi:MAG: hypothetical protein QNJ66_18360 [Crocosphaera sp.]|nr:hypothetical protein [Crocosphaera sp.]